MLQSPAPPSPAGVRAHRSIPSLCRRTGSPPAPTGSMGRRCRRARYVTPSARPCAVLVQYLCTCVYVCACVCSGGGGAAQPQHTNYWALRPRKRHQQEHRPQRPTERSDPTQHAKGRTGDCPGPRKETTTGRNVTRGGGGGCRHCCLVLHCCLICEALLGGCNTAAVTLHG